MMKVAVISKSDSQGGGASRVAEDLARGLNRCGHHATHFLAHQGHGPFTDTSRSLYGILREPTVFAQKAVRKLGLPDTIPFELPAVMAAGIARNYDLIHFHDLTTVMSPLAVRWLSSRRPACWTFHDCSPFTGGCFYPMTCTRFRERCGGHGGCPQIGKFPTDGKIDLTGVIQASKTSLHQRHSAVPLAPSQWMADLAMSSGKLAQKPLVVSNGVDLEKFKPSPDREQLRQKLGLPIGKPIVLISAADLRDERKGAKYALEALRLISDLAPLALLVGNADKEDLADIPHKVTGYITGADELAKWYAAADVFLNCSLADNQPLSILETMACATPLVGFATGGMPEMIDEGRTGSLVAQRDIKALEAALRSALQPGVPAAWGRSARQRAESHYSMDEFLQRHLSVYKSAIDDRNVNGRPEPSPVLG